MSVYPEFLQYIHDQGLYVPGYNYEEMYNIMIYTLTHNIIPTTNFIYTYQQVDELYECLEELLTPIDTHDTDETNEPQSQIQNNQNTNTDTIITIENPLDNFDDIYENDETQDEIQDEIQDETQNQPVESVDSIEPQQYTENEPNAQTVFNNYIHILNNAANINQMNAANMNHMNHANMNANQNVYYTNLTYYNNMNTYNINT